MQKVLSQTILPAIHRDGGDLQIVGLEEGVLKVKLHGACRTCPASAATLQVGVKRTLMDAFPGKITAVENVAG